jgi:hypothetical protein
MASHLTTQQVKTLASIDGYLNSIGTVTTVSSPRNRNVVRRIEKAVNDLANINDRIEAATNSSRKKRLEKERDDLYQNIKNISNELDSLRGPGGLSDEKVLQILSPTGADDPASLQRAAVLRENLKKQAEAADAEQAAAARQQEFEEQDLTDIQVIRSVYQHYLLYNTDFFAEYHNNLLNYGSHKLDGYKDPFLFSPNPNDTIIQTDGYVKRKATGEPRIFLLSDDEDSSIVNNKLSLCPGNERFTEITTAEYASLQPLLRIYKTYRNKDGAGDKKVELEFRNRTGLEGIDSLINIPQPVGAPLASHTRGVECGVKSFDWTFVGSDPFTATRDIEATLVLHAQHFSALSKDRFGPNLINNNTPLLPAQTEIINYKYLDLIIQPDCSKTSSPTNPQPYNGIYNPGCYEIQIDVGYAPQTGDLREAICCQYDSLYLVHVDHKIDFKEDGTLDLTISYRGRLETVMNDKKFNVLLPGGGFSNITKPTSGVPSLIYTYNKLENTLTTERNKGSPSASRIKELERLRASLFFSLRQYTYALILETMEDKGMIHSISLSNDHFLRFARWREPTYIGTLPPKLDLATLYSGTSTGGITSGVDNSVDIRIKAADTAAVRNPETDAVAAAIDDLTNITEQETVQRLQEAVTKKRHAINYIYLGDLLAIVLSNTVGDLELPQDIKSTIDGTTLNPKIINLGQIFGGEYSINNPFSVGVTTTEVTGSSAFIDVSQKITDPIVDNFQLVLGNIEISDQNGNSKQINLAHIPISLESFQDFMMKNVISQNRDYYSLTDFIDAVISDLVTDMFSAEHHVGLTEADSRLSVSLFTSKVPLRSSAIFEGITNQYKEINTKKIDTDNLPFGRDSKCVDRQNDPYQYLVINTFNSFPSNLAGDYLGDQGRGDNIGDKNRGILHFTYGKDRGLLKSVQFSKTDQEYLPEARFAGGDGSLLNQLSNVYDASFNMIGNNIFRPGMLIYFNPEPMGAGQPWQYKTDANGVAIARSWANIMGIGGYHLITEVAHSIGPGKFDTTVKARWQSGGEDKS